ncbi:WSC-domain-containing protein [Acephala macrosclerotiorum]|nr:WSC-domain-containing protein [Acephala macrosclerotiorum]
MQPTFFSSVGILSFLIITTNTSPLLQVLSLRDAVIPGYTDEGCYTEATNIRALTGGSYFDDLMTVEKCAAACSGYTWFGVEYGRECYCGDTINTGSVSAPSSDCSFPCPGDASETCGAGNRLNMYSIASTATATETLTTFSALGCYTEATTGRALVGLSQADNTMTVEQCASICSGFSTFGVEWYREAVFQLPVPTAKYACDGNSSEICGGDWRLNVYQFDVVTNTASATTTASTAASTPIAYAFVDCYTEATNMRALSLSSYYDDAMTVEKCAANCAAYTYFGVEYSRECYCGNTINSGSVPAPIGDCSFPCLGNGAEQCGGSNRLDLYQYGAVQPSTSSAMPTSTLLSSSSGSASSSTSATLSSSVSETSSTIQSSAAASSSSTLDITTTTSTTDLSSPTSATITTSSTIEVATTSSSDLLASSSSVYSSDSSSDVTSGTTLSSAAATTSSSSSIISSSSSDSSSAAPSSSSSIIGSSSAAQSSSPPSSTFAKSTSQSSSIVITSSSAMAISTLSSSSSSSSSSTTSSTTTSGPTCATPLSDAGFETTDASAVPWTVIYPATGNGYITFNFQTPSTTTTPHGGSQVGSISYKQYSPALQSWFNQPITLCPNTVYNFSAWHKVSIANPACNVYYYIGSADSSTVLSIFSSTAATQVTTTWKQVTATYTSGSTTAVTFNIRLTCSTLTFTAQSYYFDDISFVAA